MTRIYPNFSSLVRFEKPSFCNIGVQKINNSTDTNIIINNINTHYYISMKYLLTLSILCFFAHFVVAQNNFFWRGIALSAEGRYGAGKQKAPVQMATTTGLPAVDNTLYPTLNYAGVLRGEFFISERSHLSLAVAGGYLFTKKPISKVTFTNKVFESHTEIMQTSTQYFKLGVKKYWQFKRIPKLYFALENSVARWENHFRNEDTQQNLLHTSNTYQLGVFFVPSFGYTLFRKDALTLSLQGLAISLNPNNLKDHNSFDIDGSFSPYIGWLHFF